MKHFSLTAAFLWVIICANAQTLFPSVSFDPISVTTIAGSGISGFADGPGSTAKFGYIPGIAILNGSLFVTDSYNNRIRKISADGAVSTFAGTGTGGLVDGPAATAQFNYPFSICADKTGNLYVNDFFGSAIRKITPDGIVSTILKAGSGAAASNPYFSPCLAIDDAGNLYLSQSNNIFKLTPAGAFSVFASNVGGNNGAYELSGLAVNAQGDVCVIQYYNQTLKISSSGVVSTVMPSINNLSNGLAADKKGNVFVSNIERDNTGGTRFTKVSPALNAVFLAGNSTAGYQDGVGSAAQFAASDRAGIAADETGNLYVTDNGNFRVRKISAPVLHLLTTPGTASSPAYFSISGISLTGAATLQAPSSYEFSLTAGGPFSNTLNVSPVSGEINVVPVYVRLAATATNGTHIDSVSLSAPGAATRKIPIIGVVSTGNPPPVSIAGSNENIILPTSSVILDGSASYDPDGGIVQYYWFQAKGPVASVIANNFSKVTTATGLTAAGTYIFGLQVKDNTGVPYYSYKTVMVEPATGPVPPCVTNTSPANGSTIATQTTATLTWPASSTATSYDVYLQAGTGTPSTLVANTTALSYNATGLNANTIYSWYIAPRNANGAASTCGAGNRTSFTTAAGYQPPVSNAGSNVTITLPTSSVSLDGSASTGNIVQYYWFQARGPVQASIGNNFSAITIATGLTTAGTYVFGLQVKDNTGVPYYSFKTVTVSPATGPVPACVTNTSPANGSTITTQTTATLTWLGAPTATSYDVYLQAGTGIPLVLIVNTTALNYTVNGLTANTMYRWYVAPRNANGTAINCAAANSTTFTTAANQSTASNAGSNVTITLPVSSVSLDGSASTGNIVQYYWFQAQGPVQAAIANNFSKVTTATGLTTAGTYVFGLQVKDNTGVPYYSYKTVTVNRPATRITDTLVTPTSAARENKTSSPPSVTAVVNPNPVASGSQAKLQISSNKAGTVMINIVGSNGAIFNTKKLYLVAGMNTININTHGLAQGFNVVSITGSDAPVNLKFIVQ